MNYKVEFKPKAIKELKKLDQGQAKIIMAWIKKNLVDCEDPYRFGKALQGNLKNRWRYRIGDYRIICNIDNDKLTILVLSLGHRKDIYER